MLALRRAILTEQPDVIVPGDDGVVWQLHQAYDLFPELRPVIERSLGAPQFYSKVRSRSELLEAARHLGILAPASELVQSKAELRRWAAEHGFPAALKVDGTWGGAGVQAVRSLEEALAAFERLEDGAGAAVALKRWIVNRDPLALWSWRQRQAPAISIQQWIEGTPATAMFAAWEGRMIGGVAVNVLATQHAKGAATIVRPIFHAKIDEAGLLLAEYFQLSGFFGLDFMMEEKTGRPYLIELNPRCTQLGHLQLRGETDLAGQLAAALVGKPAPKATSPIPDGAIAFFPQSLEYAPASGGLDGLISASYLDVPEGQPELLLELREKGWPERQWVARAYHFMRGRSRRE